MISKFKSFVKRIFFIFIFMLLILSNPLISCIHLPKTLFPPRISEPKGYVSQAHIIYQGFVKIPTPFGNKSAVFFGYDRDNKYSFDINGNKVHVDLLEFKLIKPIGWNYEPFLIFSDDDYDGYADRLLLDSDLDGKWDKSYNLESKKLSMNEIIFEEMNPWRDIEKPDMEL